MFAIVHNTFKRQEEETDKDDLKTTMIKTNQQKHLFALIKDISIHMIIVTSFQ